ncbi:GNAT family N-acetyltransferase [Kurthia huakuii]|uniref:GNAT family N-acetyltransferase n=1 Tax=Kurthia huakuii TaxID=1421019 RepID=UPI0004AFA7C0|nr:GNAT family N-acetyltransferase [Kurthia huakuii]MBM7699441.1 hypothetical protein [Kurthia huakuii]
MNHQQIVINNLAEKLKLFTSAVNGELVDEADFIFANTGIPTDTFNVPLKKAAPIKNTATSWRDLMQQYRLNEAERNTMMKLENILHVGDRKTHQLIITPVRNVEEFHEYQEVFLSLFEGTMEKIALAQYFNTFSEENLSSTAQMFIGRVDEVTVSTGLLIDSSESYGIYDVMTKERFRGKGYGSEMFHYLLTQTTDKQKPVVL